MGTLVLAGATSGSTTLTPVDAVTTVLTLPSSTATLATLGANTFVGNQAVTGALTVSTTLGVTGTISTTAGNINSVLAQNGASGFSASNSTNGTSARAYTLLISSAGNGGIAATSPLYSDVSGAGDSLTIFASGLSGGIQHIIDGGSSQLTVASTGVTIPGTLGVTGATTLQGLTVGLGAGAISTNTAVGYLALFSNTSGAYNTAIGNLALYSNTTTSFNVAIGDRALYSNTTGTQNTASGIQALYSNLTGIYNVADGAQALYNNTGSYNTGCGHSALSANTSGSGNTAISPNNSSGSYAPVFDPTTQSNRFCMGSTGVTNAYIQVAWTVVSDARDKTDFAPVPHGLDFVSKLKPTSYRYKMSREDTEGHGPIRYGFKAQDVLALEGIDPVIVDAEDAEKLRFNDQSMIAVLVNAIQELAAKVAALENK